MNYKQVIYVTTTVECGSLSGAAKKLYVTVQAVSKAVADLEKELGCTLFVREGHGTRPTAFGKAFYKRAQGVIAGFEDLEQFAQQYEGLRTRRPDPLRLALNTPPFVGNEVVRENATAYVKSRLCIDTTIDLATGKTGLEGLQGGCYDALITIGLFTHPDTVCHPLGTVPAGIMICSDHPLAEKNQVTLADLEPFPAAMPQWFSRANTTLASRYRDQGAPLRFVELELEDVGRHLEEQGIIFTTGIPALGRLHPSTTVRLIASEDNLTVPLCIVWLKERDEVLSPLFGTVLNKENGGPTWPL